jgi:2-polyprenyl-3-methyl-5-hydroxy-6-metoxy-1,4-benzoquinol methylase
LDNELSAEPPAFNCRVCGSPAGTRHVFRERMFGMGGAFEYFECGNCGCIQLVDVPADLSRYYPADKYYSLQGTTSSAKQIDPSRLPKWLRLLKNRYYFFGRPAILKPLTRFSPPPDTDRILSLMEGVPLQSFDAKILDVGCGRGDQLVALSAVGFRRLHGVDPFLSSTPNPAPGVTLHKCEIADLPADGFDLIMMNHSFEHVTHPKDVLLAAARRLAPGGVLRIEIPVADSAAWREYGQYWVDLDAPRHLFIHTRQSMSIAAEAAGLDLYETEPRSDMFEFWVSELYKSGITLYEPENPRYWDIETRQLADRKMEFFNRALRANVENDAARRLFRLRRRGA